VRRQLLVTRRAHPTGARRGHPPRVPRLLQRPAQPLRRVHRRTHPERDRPSSSSPADSGSRTASRSTSAWMPDSEPSCSVDTAGSGTRAIASSPVWARRCGRRARGPSSAGRPGSPPATTGRPVRPRCRRPPTRPGRRRPASAGPPESGQQDGSGDRRRAAISAGAAPVWTSSRTSCASRLRTVRAVSRRSRSTAISCVTP